MPTLLMLKGLPGSGKSTYAKELCRTQDYYRVNKDDLRSMVHAGRWGKEREKFILHWRDEIVKDSLGGLKNVVVDDTNFEPKHEIALQAIAKVWKADFQVKFFDTPVEECIKRDLERPNSVGAGIIWQMYNKYLKPPAPTYAPTPGLPEAIICDIDGTLAHMNGRGPYDWDKVGSDLPDMMVIEILQKYFLQRDLMDEKPGLHIILLSGRDGICYPQTVEWLQKYNVPHDELYMRPAGNMEKDTVIKRQIFDEHIRGKYNIKFVLDDRNSVVKMWREAIGLKVLQVAEGDF